MVGDSQGKGILETNQEFGAEVSQKSCVTSLNTLRSGASGARRTPAAPRDRVSFADAAQMRRRVEDAASPLKLRGARAGVLAAVLALTCGYKRIDDDAVALRHIAARIPGGRVYDAKTLGRALAGLAAASLIVYRPARGRGAKAYIGIHPRFLDGVEVLARDASGRVIAPVKPAQTVTFSERPYKESRSKKKNYPPTPQPSPRSPVVATRPAEVEISPAEVTAVLRQLPQHLGQLPARLRWRLGGLIRDKLRSGWLPEQILEILAAPMPEAVAAPFSLARWRLVQNMPGAGPRLQPLQQAFDRRESACAQQAADAVMAHWYGQVLDAASAADRERLLLADTAKFGRVSESPVAALAAAGRRAARLFPDLPLAQGLRRWAEEVLSGEPAPPTVGPADPAMPADLLIDLALGEQCVVCDQHPGSPRPQLPLMSTVCEGCWPMIAAELAADNDDELAVSA